MTRVFAGKLLAFSLSAAFWTALPTFSLAQDFAVEIEPLGMYSSAVQNKGAAADLAYSAGSKNLYVVNRHLQAIDIVGIFNPAAPRLVRHVSILDWGARITDVAVNADTVAAAISGTVAADRGLIVLFDLDGKFLRSFPVGYSPGMVAFTPDGAFVLSADEGVPEDNYAADPPGSITIAATDGSSVRTVSFEGAPTRQLHLAAPVGTSPIADIEPEAIALSADGRTAYVTLQENNAIAAVDIETATLKSIFGLGLTEWTIERDSADGAPQFAVHQLYQPGNVAVYETAGRRFLVTANGGGIRRTKAFSDAQPIGALALDTRIANAEAFRPGGALADLEVSLAAGDIDNDGDLDRIVTFAGHSISVWTPEGARVSDHDALAENAPSEPGSRQGKAGPTPWLNRMSDSASAGLVLAEIEGRMIAFLGIRCEGQIIALDITDPSAIRRVGRYAPPILGGPDKRLQNNGSPSGGLVFIRASDSPTGAPLLAAASGGSGTVTILTVKVTGTPPAPPQEITPPPPQPDTAAETAMDVAQPPPTAPRPEPTAGVGRFQLQIAAAGSAEDAGALAAAVIKKHAAILEQAPSEIQEVAGPNGKTLYRVRIGAFEDRQSAAEICARLKSAGQDCFVVAR